MVCFIWWIGEVLLIVENIFWGHFSHINNVTYPYGRVSQTWAKILWREALGCDMVTISVIISGTVRRMLMNLFDVSRVDLVVKSQGLLPIQLLLFIHKLPLLLSLLLHFSLNIFHCRFDDLTRSQRNCLVLKNFFGLSFLVELHIASHLPSSHEYCFLYRIGEQSKW